MIINSTLKEEKALSNFYNYASCLIYKTQKEELKGCFFVSFQGNKTIVKFKKGEFIYYGLSDACIDDIINSLAKFFNMVNEGVFYE
jgi:hypothetical protein